MATFIEVNMIREGKDDLIILLNFDYVSAVSLIGNDAFLNLVEGNNTPYTGMTVRDSYEWLKQLLHQRLK